MLLSALVLRHAARRGLRVHIGAVGCLCAEDVTVTISKARIAPRALRCVVPAHACTRARARARCGAALCGAAASICGCVFERVTLTPPLTRRRRRGPCGA
jgi:hypothetical protein